MQKIERQKKSAVSQAPRRSWLSLISIALLCFLVFLPLFDSISFGERPLSLFVGVDVVVVLSLFLAHKFLKKHMDLPVTGIQIAAFALFGVGLFVFLNNEPALDSFFGIHDEPLRAFLPLALFAFTIFCVPLLRIDKKTIHLFLRASFILPLLALPTLFLGSDSATVGFVSIYALLVGAFTLPLSTSTFRTFLTIAVVAGVCMFEFFMVFPTHLVVIIPLILFCLYSIVRMLNSLRYERSTQHIATRLVHNPALRIRGVLSVVFLVGIITLFVVHQEKVDITEYGIGGIRAVTSLQEVNLDGGFRVLFADVQYREKLYPAAGTLIRFAEGAGPLGAVACVGLILAALYSTLRTLHDPEYYDKTWYLFLQANAAAAFFGTLYAIFMPLPVGGMLLLATSYGMLSVCIIKLAPERVFSIATVKHHVLRSLTALALGVCVLLAGYYTIRYAIATSAAQKNDFTTAYQYVPVPQYLAQSITYDSRKFRVALLEGGSDTETLDLARRVTTRIVEARRQYPDNIQILLIALSHYELLTRVGVSGAVDESLTVLEKLSTLYPASSDLVLRYAAALLEAKKPREAFAVLEKNTKKFEEEPSPVYDHLFAYVLMALEDYAAAANRFEQILTAGGKEVTSATYLAYAVSRIHTNIPSARNILKTALMKFPRDAQVYIYAALAAQIDNDRGVAKVILEEGLRNVQSTEAQNIHILLDELTQKGSITSIGIAGLKTPEPINLSVSTVAATTTQTTGVTKTASSTDVLQQ